MDSETAVAYGRDAGDKIIALKFKKCVRAFVKMTDYRWPD